APPGGDGTGVGPRASCPHDFVWRTRLPKPRAFARLKPEGEPAVLPTPEPGTPETRTRADGRTRYIGTQTPLEETPTHDVGAPVPTAPVKFRQSPDFYYLTGIEEPDAVAVFDGRTRSAFVFASKRGPGELRVNGPGVWEAGDAAAVYGITRLFEPERFFDV